MSVWENQSLYDIDDGVTSQNRLIFQYVVEGSELSMSWNFQLNPTSFWITVLVTKSNFFENIFLNNFPFFSKKIVFLLRHLEMSTCSISRFKDLVFLLQNPKFQDFSTSRRATRLDLRTGSSYFFYKSEQNVDQARLMPQQWNRLKLLPQIELVKLYRLG